MITHCETFPLAGQKKEMSGNAGFAARAIGSALWIGAASVPLSGESVPSLRLRRGLCDEEDILARVEGHRR